MNLKRVTPNEGAKLGGRENLRFLADTALAE